MMERRPRDFYPTPAEAVQPLRPYLPPSFAFAEPQAGDGQLVRHIEALGGVCVEAFDICPQDSRVETGDCFTRRVSPVAELVICNPSWARPLLHRWIAQVDRPTWMLFDTLDFFAALAHCAEYAEDPRRACRNAVARPGVD